MKEEVLDSGYRPRPLQEYLHRVLHFVRFAVLVCHRRFGKTVFAINHIIDSALNLDRRNPQFAYIAPTYGQAKRVAWEFLKEYTRHYPGVKMHESELKVVIPRPHKDDKVTIYLLGAENPDSLRGMYLDGGILDEYALCDPSIWGEIIRPALADRKGKFIFIGTPKGQNHFWELYAFAEEVMEKAGELYDEGEEVPNKYKSWYAKVYKASETGVLDEDELEGARMAMSKEEYAQEFECSFTASMTGAYYSKYMQDAINDKRICSVPWDPSVCVSTFWDMGMADATTIWFMQKVGQEWHAIDYIERSGMGLDYYANQILNQRPYVYDEHVLPHDAAARELGTGKSREEVLRKLGLRTRILARADVMDGINAVRVVLPMVWFDKVKCKKGIHALSFYQKEWDGKRKVFKQSPRHDWSSHGADGFRTFGMGRRNPITKGWEKVDRQAQGEWNVFGQYDQRGKSDNRVAKRILGGGYIP